MKKISSAILAAVALAAFGFVSCDHDYSNSDIQAGTPHTVKQAEIDAANKGGSDEDANKGGSDEEEEGDAKTDFFETFASTGTAWGSAWVTLDSGTTTLKSGTKIVSGGDTKMADKTDSTWSDAVACCQLGKSGNNNSLVVPVAGNCTISIYYDSNKVPNTDCRSLLATVSSGTVSVDGGTAEKTAFHNNASLSEREKATVVFTYTGSGEDVVFTVNKSATESASGACYIYGVKVAYN